MPVAAECDGRQIRVRREGERGTDRTQSAQEGSSSSSAATSALGLGEFPPSLLAHGGARAAHP